MKRDGFALLSVLWVMLAASVLATAAALATREAVDSATNRVQLERALWRANDCLERTLASVDAILGRDASDNRVLQAWRSLDRRLSEAPLRVTQCSVAIEAAGARLDVTAATASQLKILLQLLDAADPTALSQRVVGRRPIDDVRELAAIGVDAPTATLESLLTVDGGRLCLNHAGEVVLRTVPGFTPELVERVMLERASGREITDVPSLASRISRPAADSVMAHYREVVGLTVTSPDAWILVAQGWSGEPPARVNIDARLVLDGRRGAVVRRRAWTP